MKMAFYLIYLKLEASLVISEPRQNDSKFQETWDREDIHDLNSIQTC